MFRLLIAGLKTDKNSIKRILSEGVDINLTFTKEQIEESGVSTDVCVSELPQNENGSKRRYIDLADRSLLDLYFETVIAAWTNGSFGISCKLKFNGYLLSEHLNFVVELFENKARPKQNCLARSVFHFIALNLVLIELNSRSDEISLEAREVITASTRLLEMFAQHYDQFILKEFPDDCVVTSEEIRYVSTLLSQKQLPHDRQLICDLTLSRLLNLGELFPSFGIFAVDAIEEKSDWNHSRALLYLFRMYRVKYGKFNLKELEAWGKKTLETLDCFTEQGKKELSWYNIIEEDVASTWPDLYLSRSKALILELMRLKAHNKAKEHLREWLHFLSGYFLKCFPRDTDEVELLFDEWKEIVTFPLEKDFIIFASNFFNRSEVSFVSLDLFYLFHSAVLEQTNASNVASVAKPLLTMMNLILALLEGREKRIPLNPQLKTYLSDIPNLAHFKKCANQLEEIIKVFDTLSSRADASGGIIVGLVKRIEKNEETIAKQQDQIVAQQAEITRMKQRLDALESAVFKPNFAMLFSGSDSSPPLAEKTPHLMRRPSK